MRFSEFRVPFRQNVHNSMTKLNDGQSTGLPVRLCVCALSAGKFCPAASVSRFVFTYTPIQLEHSWSVLIPRSTEGSLSLSLSLSMLSLLK